MKKICLAYSGGLDTSVILAWLRETYKVPVVAYVGDVGQNEDIDAIKKKALATGAESVHVVDLKDEFVRDFVFPAVQGKAVYEGTYLLGTALARPILAKAQVDVALKAGCDAVSHGATGKGNDQVRFELTARALAPQLKVVAPWREWSFTGRMELIDYAKAHNIPVSQTKEKPYSSDANLMHISYEGGVLEDAWAAAPDDMFQLTASPQQAPDDAQEITIDFSAGDPVAVNGEALRPAALLTKLNAVAGRHGVGRVDVVENRFIGIKSRGVYETPGGTVLHLAHRAVESITMDREVMHLRDALAPKFAELIYYGFWYAPEMKALRALINESQKNVTGTARVKLYKGTAIVTGRKSPKSLYKPEVASFETTGGFSPSDSTGFIRLQGLRL